MKTTLKRTSVASLLVFLGLMVAPLGASEPVESKTCETSACDAGEKGEATNAEASCVEKTEKTADVGPGAAPEKTNAEIVADARKAKFRTIRAKQAKTRREWVKFAFGKNESTGIDKEYFFGPSTRGEFARNAREWVDFAFGGTE